MSLITSPEPQCPSSWRRELHLVKKHSRQISRWKMNGRLLNQRTNQKYLSCRLLDTWKVFSENIAFLLCLPLCSFPVTSQRCVWSPCWLPQLLGVATVTSCSELGTWGHSLTVGKGQLPVPYVPWQKLCDSCSLSSQFTVTHNQGYSIHCHTLIRDKICRDRDSPCCF